MKDLFKQEGYRRPIDITGLVKIVTVFGVRYAAQHDLVRKSDTVAVAEGDAMSRTLHRCYIVGKWPQPRTRVLRRRKEIVDGLRSLPVPQKDSADASVTKALTPA